ncbi:hypothetical protein D3C72_942000 [compost metagenome]
MPPMAKVSVIMALGLTPISVATRGFSATARIPRPRRVYSTSSHRPIITASASDTVTMPVTVMIAGGWFALPEVTAIASIGRICGNISGLRLQIIIATVCSNTETPIPEISGARRGALRRRR